MTEPIEKDFDCVKFMRERRDAISEAIAEFGWSEVNAWLQNQSSADPEFRKLLEEKLGNRQWASETHGAAKKA